MSDHAYCRSFVSPTQEKKKEIETHNIYSLRFAKKGIQTFQATVTHSVCVHFVVTLWLLS